MITQQPSNLSDKISKPTANIAEKRKSMVNHLRFQSTGCKLTSRSVDNRYKKTIVAIYPVYIMQGQGISTDDMTGTKTMESFDIIVDAVKR